MSRGRQFAGVLTVGTVGTAAVLFCFYLRWGDLDTSLALALRPFLAWPWLAFSVTVTLLSSALPLAYARFTPAKLPVPIASAWAWPWVVTPVAFFVSYPGTEAVGRYSDPGALVALGLIGWLQTWVSASSARLAREGQAAPEGPFTPRAPLYSEPKRPDPRQSGWDAEELGWARGVLADDRPFLAEWWEEEEDEMSGISFFFSASGLEDATDADLTQLLQRSGVVREIRSGAVQPGKLITDENGVLIWSVTAVLDLRGEVTAESDLQFAAYE